MPKTIAVTCQLCLGVQDPADVLAVKIEHAAVPQPEAVRLCRLCTLAIMKSAIASELIDPSEVFGADSLVPSPEVASDEAPDKGAAAGSLSPPPVPDTDEPAASSSSSEHRGNGADLAPMPFGRCALDCGQPAASGDLYCEGCRSSLRGEER